MSVQLEAILVITIFFIFGMWLLSYIPKDKDNE